MTLYAILEQIEQSIPDHIDPDTLAFWYDTIAIWRETARRINAAAQLADTMCAELIPRTKGATLEVGGRTFRRSGTPSRKAWQTDDLLRVVLDTRVADENGEPIDETQADKIRAVWNLGAPRLTELQRRRIDPDEFCTTDWTNTGIREVLPEERE